MCAILPAHELNELRNGIAFLQPRTQVQQSNQHEPNTPR